MIVHYNKLVRDHIPEIIKRQGKRVVFRELKGGELKKALKEKLVEETQELINAETYDQIIEEMADVLEVLETMCRRCGFSMVIAKMAQRRKEGEKGGFLKGYFLESVGDEK